MKENELLKEIPIIVISSQGSTTLMDQLYSNGIKKFLKKPFTPEQIKLVFNEAMEIKNEC